MNETRVVVGVMANRESIELTSMRGSHEPDPKWQYTDPYGHTHSHARLTWRWVFDGPEYYIDVDGEEWNGEGHYECLVCGSEIEPGTIYKPPSPYRQYVPGLVTYTAEYSDGSWETITEAEYQEWCTRFATGRQR